MKIILTILIFLILGAFFIISNENLALRDSNAFDQFTDLYYDWLNSLFDNGKDITGYVVNSDWLPDTV
jgi:uncharacterized protein YxeA